MNRSSERNWENRYVRKLSTLQMLNNFCDWGGNSIIVFTVGFSYIIFITPFRKIGVQNFPKTTKNINARSFARENGSQFLLI